MRRLLSALLLALATLVVAAPAHAERVRDLGSFDGVRPNQLTGYGIVVGLDGTGDDNFEYLTEAMRGVSGRWRTPGLVPASRVFVVIAFFGGVIAIVAIARA